jgi:hypothetical protein
MAEGVANTAAIGDAAVDGVGESSAWSDGLVGSGAAYNVDVLAGPLAYPEQIGSHVEYSVDLNSIL